MFEGLRRKPAAGWLVAGVVVVLVPLGVAPQSASAGTGGSARVTVGVSCGTTPTPAGGRITITFTGLPTGTVTAPASVTALGPNWHFTFSGLGWAWDERGGAPQTEEVSSLPAGQYSVSTSWQVGGSSGVLQPNPTTVTVPDCTGKGVVLGGTADPAVGIASTPTAHEYSVVFRDGTYALFGTNPNYPDGTAELGRTTTLPTGSSVTGVAVHSTPSGTFVLADGEVFPTTDGEFSVPQLQGVVPAAPIVGMASTAKMIGNWLVGSDGGVFAVGILETGPSPPPYVPVPFYGSAVGLPLRAPVVGIAAPDNHGYWLVAADGGVFSFGDAGFYGSAAGLPLRAPIVGIASTPDGKGYWLVAADGGVFSFGDAGFYGSAGHLRLHAPIVGMSPTPDGQGYWLAGADGGVFAYGDAGYYGSMG